MRGLRPSGGSSACESGVARRIRLAEALFTLAVVGPLVGPPARAGDADDAAATASERALIMQRFVVSDARVDRNPWRYAAVPGFEILTRASERATNWRIDALRRGLWIENKLMPREWLPDPAVPYTVIVDDTNISTVPESQIHVESVAMGVPHDALTWGDLSSDIHLSVQAIGSHDTDTVAINDNLYGVNTSLLMDSTMSLERLDRAVPALPTWLTAGLTGRTSGIFREAFSLMPSPNGLGVVEKAAGPGVLWVSLQETQRLLKLVAHDPHDPSIKVPPLTFLFSEARPPKESRLLWESEAALFVRWGLLPSKQRNPAMAEAFLRLVTRARHEPVTEALVVQCFGFGFARMEAELSAYLRETLAQPTFVKWDMPNDWLVPVRLKPATSDQIGRVLGDWLRMKGESLGDTDPALAGLVLKAAGRLLERAYRNDNGLAPDVDPDPHGAPAAAATPQSDSGPVTVMKPFVVSAEHIHDPRLLAVYGLYEHDIGADAKARELLEAAARAHVVRPRVYAVLAALRSADAVAHPLGSDGKLSAQQAASILGDLQIVAMQSSTPDAASQIVELWANCDATPSAGDISNVIHDVALFPRDTDLAYNAALLCAQSGYPREAAQLIDEGLLFTTHQLNRDYFERLRATLGAPSEK